jgi:ParB-like partition proteins
MAKVKYKEISEKLEKLAAPAPDSLTQRGSIYSSVNMAEYYNIDVDKLIPFSKQARRVFDEQELQGLADSIKQHGVRQPLTIIKSPNNNSIYEIVSGERRLRAARLAGLTQVPCIILSDYEAAEEIALIENLQRKDLHPVEIGNALKELLTVRKNLTQQEICKKLGLRKQYVSEMVQYAELPKEVKDEVLKHNITSRDILRKLLKSPAPLEVIKQSYHADPQKELPIKNSNRSILRVFLKEGSIKVQANGIKLLSRQEKEELKSILDSMI